MNKDVARRRERDGGRRHRTDPRFVTRFRSRMLRAEWIVSGRSSVVAVLVLASLTGCWGPPGVLTLRPGDAPRLEFGMTQSELAEALEGRTCWRFEAQRAMHNRAVYRSWARYERSLVHQFTITHDNGRVLLCMQSQVIRPSFLFLLTDGELTRIEHHPGMAAIDDPATAMRAILAAPSIGVDEMASIIQREVDDENGTRRLLEPPPIPYILFPTRRGAELRSRAQLLEKYDALKLRLGMLPSDVSEIFGPPEQVRPLSADRLEWVYRGRSDQGPHELIVTVVFDARRLCQAYTQLLPMSDAWMSGFD